MTDNIPPEIADDTQMTLGMLIETLRSIPPTLVLKQLAKPRPAPARISPEVRETIRNALILQMSESSYTEDGRYLDAIAFVEALP